MRVLVVDDEEDVQILFRLVLEAEGHEVQVASNGAEARQRCREGVADVLVLDVSLPEEDGPTLLGVLREEGIAPPEVFLTSAVTPTALGVLARGLEARPLSKPFTIKSLRESLGVVLDA